MKDRFKYRLKALLILLLVLIVFISSLGCKASQPHCDAYGFSVIDTLYIPPTHLNYEGECYEYSADTFVLIDTIFLPHPN